MKKFFPLCLLLIVALVWTLSVAGSLEKAPNALYKNQIKSGRADRAATAEKQKASEKAAIREKAAREKSAAVDVMTPEKTARLEAEKEAKYQRIRELTTNVGPKAAPGVTSHAPARPSVQENTARALRIEELNRLKQAEMDRYRLIDIKADGVIDASERPDYERLRSDTPAEPLPTPLNIVSETEPNDVCTSANGISCGDTVWCATLTDVSDDSDWYTFTLDNSYSFWKVIIETHATSGACEPAMDDTYLELWTGDCSTLITSDDDGGQDYFSLINTALPPGTYAILSYNNYDQTGSYHMSLLCNGATTGDYCGDPIVVPSVPYSDLNQTTCGRGNFYENTCLGYYDGGEDIIYEFTLTQDTCIDVTVDFKNTSWGGFCIDDVCPPDDNCLAVVTSSGSGIKTSGSVTLTAGTYYIMVDTWAPPDCIPDFDLSIDYVSCYGTWDCSDNPPDGKTGGGVGDIEPNDTCTVASEALCEYAYCGAIDAVGDVDWYYVDIPNDGQYGLHVRVFGNDTPHQYAQGGGLDPWVGLYAADCTTLVVSNEDYYGTFPDAENYDSQLDPGGLNCFDPGTRVYIAIESNYDPEMGPYLLIVNCVPCECDITCPTGSTPEGEPTCYDGYDDTFNGGCNSTPPVFSTVDCGDTICGETGTFLIGTDQYRDTDWYEFTTARTVDITINGVAETPLYMAVYEGNCPPGITYGSIHADQCSTFTFTASNVPPGTYYIFAAVDAFVGYACGSEYWFSVQCDTLTGNGRCCYGSPYTPSCIDTDELDCYNTYGGVWSYGLNCTDDPCPAIPANDSCQDRITVTVPSSTAGTTENATLDAFLDCGPNITTPGVWYSVIGTGNTMTASTCDPIGYDTKLSVYCNSCDFPVCVDGNDDDTLCTGYTTRSTVTWCSEAGTEYMILVHGYGGATGAFMLHVSDDGVACQDPPDCNPPDSIWNCIEDPPLYIAPDGKTAGGIGDIEPNDICADASPAQCEYAYCGDISSETDVDWYAVTLPADTTYALHIRVFGNDTPNQYAQGLGLDPRIELWAPGCTTMVAYNEDYFGTFPDAEDYDSQIDPSEPGNCFPGGSTVYIAIYTYYLWASPGPYLLIINCEPCEVVPVPWNCIEDPPVWYLPTGKLSGGNGDVEPNDVCTQAAPVQCEYAYCGNIDADSIGPSDWYYVDLPADSYYALHVRVFGDDTPNQYAYGLGADPWVGLYKSDCVTLAAYNDDYFGTFPDAVTFDSQIDPGDPGNCFAPGSRVYIEITGSPYGTSQAGPYLLIINCEPCIPPTGACCVYDQCVATDIFDECLVLGGDWYVDEDCADFTCPIIHCDTTSLFGQEPSLPDDIWGLYLSEPDLGGSGPGDLTYENFSGLIGDVCDVHFWGVRISYVGEECSEDPMPFEFTFYPDNAGIPDTANPICSYVDTISGVGTGYLYYIFDFDLTVESIYYETVFDSCCAITDGWISIAASGDANCWFLWLSSGDVGSGFAYQMDMTDNSLTSYDQDLSLCLTPGEAPIGRCCYDQNTACVDTTEAACTALGGNWDEALNCTDNPCPTGDCCDHIVGDVNGSDSYNGLDITYGVNFFKGGPDPLCVDCPADDCNSFNYCGDVNGSCSYNGLDITYGVNYFKGGPNPLICVDCPPCGTPSDDVGGLESPSVIKDKPVIEQKPEMK